MSSLTKGGSSEINRVGVEKLHETFHIGQCLDCKERDERVMLSLTEIAVNKVKENLSQQSESYLGLRVAVVAGGCSGFQYTMNFERGSREDDQVLEIEGLKIFLDPQSSMYLEGTEIDYVETMQEAGFKFRNPNVTETCGCGESFSV